MTRVCNDGKWAVVVPANDDGMCIAFAMTGGRMAVSPYNEDCRTLLPKRYMTLLPCHCEEGGTTDKAIPPPPVIARKEARLTKQSIVIPERLLCCSPLALLDCFVVRLWLTRSLR